MVFIQGEGGQAERGNAALADRLDSLARWGRVVGGLTQWREAFDTAVGVYGGGVAKMKRGGRAICPTLRRSLAAGALGALCAAIAPARSRQRWGLCGLAGGFDRPRREEAGEGDDSLRVARCARRGDVAAAERDVAALRALKDVLRGLVWAEQALDTVPPADYRAFYGQVRAASRGSHLSPPAGIATPSSVGGGRGAGARRAFPRGGGVGPG